jgi:hypothetical protein
MALAAAFAAAALRIRSEGAPSTPCSGHPAGEVPPGFDPLLPCFRVARVCWPSDLRPAGAGHLVGEPRRHVIPVRGSGIVRVIRRHRVPKRHILGRLSLAILRQGAGVPGEERRIPAFNLLQVVPTIDLPLPVELFSHEVMHRARVPNRPVLDPILYLGAAEPREIRPAFRPYPEVLSWCVFSFLGCHRSCRLYHGRSAES